MKNQKVKEHIESVIDEVVVPLLTNVLQVELPDPSKKAIDSYITTLKEDVFRQLGPATVEQYQKLFIDEGRTYQRRMIDSPIEVQHNQVFGDVLVKQVKSYVEHSLKTFEIIENDISSEIRAKAGKDIKKSQQLAEEYEPRRQQNFELLTENLAPNIADSIRRTAVVLMINSDEKSMKTSIQARPVEALEVSRTMEVGGEDLPLEKAFYKAAQEFAGGR